MGPNRTLAELLAEAEARIARHSPADAYEALRSGALLVDVRSAENRERDGIVPGSIHIPRTVLEWRFELDGPWRSPHVDDPDVQVILMCDHGYATILAAATLVEIGFARAGDVVGGFQAWKESGLPVAEAPPRFLAADELAGMEGPD